MIAVLTTSFLTGIQNNPDMPQEVKDQANVELAAGIPFISDADLETAMQEAGQSQAVTQAALDANRQARVDGLDAALAVLALITRAGTVLHHPDPEDAGRGGAGPGRRALTGRRRRGDGERPRADAH